MLVRDIMTTRIYPVTPETPVSKVANLIAQFRISGTPVVDPGGGKLLDIIVLGDIHQALFKCHFMELEW